MSTYACLSMKEREKEREAREEEMALLQRMKEAELFKEWESQEDDVRRESPPPASFRAKVAFSFPPVPPAASQTEIQNQDRDWTRYVFRT